MHPGQLEVQIGLVDHSNDRMRLLNLIRLKNSSFLFVLEFNPQAPVAQKVADEVVFRRFQGEGVEFFKIGPH